MNTVYRLRIVPLVCFGRRMCETFFQRKIALYICRFESNFLHLQVHDKIKDFYLYQTMEKDSIKCYCSSCKQHTHHKVLAVYKRGSEPDDDYWWTQNLRMVQCLGCDHVSFDIETVEESNVDYDEFTGNVEYVPVHVSYPDKEGLIECIGFTWNFPQNVYAIYRETINALNNGCLRLAAAGFRATVEAICIDKQIAFKNLEAKINGLKKSGIITEADRNRLHAVRFMGNDAVHQMMEPSKESLLLVHEIISGILTNLYVIDDKTNGKLERPVKTIEEFINILDEGLSNRHVGEVDILKNLLPENRRLIKEDRTRFEAELKEKINNGEYSKLSLCPSPNQGQNQQYKIEAI